jgi:hypothetical protein
MTVPGLLILIGALNTGAVAQTEFERFAETASGWLLEGQRLPRDYRVTLMEMDSADRIQAIAYLRRLGLLNERPWSLDDLLRPAATRTEPRE